MIPKMFKTLSIVLLIIVWLLKWPEASAAYLPSESDRLADSLTWETDVVISNFIQRCFPSNRYCTKPDVKESLELLHDIAHVNWFLENWRLHSACLDDDEETLRADFSQNFTTAALGYTHELQKLQNHTMDRKFSDRLKIANKKYLSDPYSSREVNKKVVNLEEYQKIAEKVNFCTVVETNGGTYLGFHNDREDEVEEVIKGQRDQDHDVFVLFLKDFSMAHGETCNSVWQETRKNFFEKMRDGQRSKVKFYAIDCRFNHERCNGTMVPSIQKYRGGALLFKDLLANSRNLNQNQNQNQIHKVTVRMTSESFPAQNVTSRNNARGTAAAAAAQTSKQVKNRGLAGQTGSKPWQLVVLAVLAGFFSSA